MTSRQLDEEAVFHAARVIPTLEARSSYLDQVCAGDQALRERVEALLDVHEQEQDFLKSSPEPAATVDQPPISEGPGHQVGRYKLLQKIGEGGFGVVYMAEQQRPVRRKVALKIIKPGMDTGVIVARFEAERQALALMDHANIARVFDGGATDSGRPYFVMELVKGVPITEYCDKNALSTHDRLQLFIAVCQAVQHAHQKGMIHRDLKSSNILVTLHDGQPVIKVIDFGVAKAINQRLTEKTLFTAFGQMVGTPQYMSPEQAEMSGLDVDTRSDIYSLGVLLYELLTGTTPLEAERLRTTGYAEMQRIIREEEPPKPSTRLSGSSERLTIIAKQRSATPERLHRLVRGDLDWIVMKALEKDRSRRYDAANTFAEDVERFLHDEPVIAHSPSAVYRFHKFARRNRAALTTTVAITASLVLGIVATSWLAIERAQSLRQERRAVKQAKQTLSQLHNLLIERALLQALVGEKAEFDRTLQLAKRADVPSDWLATLEGCAELHQGDAEKAHSLLKRAVAENPQNTSAHAMLAIAHVWNGDWNSWSLLVEDVLSMQPRAKYRDFDALFLAYARFYIDHETAAQELAVLLADKPTWIVPRALMAAAWSHAAAIHENRRYAERALEEIEVPQLMAGDNPFVLMTALGVYLPALQLMGPEEAELRKRGDEIARELRKYRQIPVTAHMRALYYQLVEDRAQQELALADVLERGSGMLLEHAIAAQYEMNDTEAVLGMEAKCVEVSIAKAYVLARSSNLDHRARARTLYRELNRQHCTWYVRYKLLQLLLLLEETAEARRICGEWLSTSKGVEHSGNWERKSIAFIAGNLSDEEFVAKGDDPVGSFFVNYQRAFRALSKGDREAALKHFRAAAEWDFPDERRQWARAFAARLSDELGAGVGAPGTAKRP